MTLQSYEFISIRQFSELNTNGTHLIQSAIKPYTIGVKFENKNCIFAFANVDSNITSKYVRVSVCVRGCEN